MLNPTLPVLQVHGHVSSDYMFVLDLSEVLWLEGIDYCYSHVNLKRNNKDTKIT